MVVSEARFLLGSFVLYSVIWLKQCAQKRHDVTKIKFVKNYVGLVGRVIYMFLGNCPPKTPPTSQH